jgi:hypothetical protein
MTSIIWGGYGFVGIVMIFKFLLLLRVHRVLLV